MLLNSEQLAPWCGYKRTADIISWLDSNGIPWTSGKDKEICTTLDAVTSALQGEEQRKPARFT